MAPDATRSDADERATTATCDRRAKLSNAEISREKDAIRLASILLTGSKGGGRDCSAAPGP